MNDFYSAAMPFVGVSPRMAVLLQKVAYFEPIDRQEALMIDSLRRARQLVASLNNEAQENREEFLVRTYTTLELAACLASNTNIFERFRECGFNLDFGRVFTEA